MRKSMRVGALLVALIGATIVPDRATRDISVMVTQQQVHWGEPWSVVALGNSVPASQTVEVTWAPQAVLRRAPDGCTAEGALARCPVTGAPWRFRFDYHAQQIQAGDLVTVTVAYQGDPDSPVTGMVAVDPLVYRQYLTPVSRP